MRSERIRILMVSLRRILQHPLQRQPVYRPFIEVDRGESLPEKNIRVFVQHGCQTALATGLTTGFIV